MYKDITMTGEITLRGKVLPVGGVKEKLLAAYRAGLFEILLPRDNAKDLEDVPAEVRSELKIHLVEQMHEVLELALEPPSTELDDAPAAGVKLGDDEGVGSNIETH